MYVCEELEASRIRVFTALNKGVYWLKTELRIASEILRIDPASLERESRCIDGSIILPPLLITDL